MTFTLSMPGIPTVVDRHDHLGQRQGDVQDDRAQGRRRRPGQRDRPGLDRRLRVDRRTSRSSRSPSSGVRRRVDSRQHSQATIAPCRCGAVRTAGHPRPRRPGAGSADDPAPPAAPAGTSADRSPPSSATAGWTGSDGPFGAMRSGPAGRSDWHPPSRPRRVSRTGPGRPIARTMIEPLFGSSSSSRCGRRGPPRARCGSAAAADSALGPSLGLDDATDQPSVTVGAIGPAWSLWGEGDL